jgi:4-diphosphocytidyl-2-C-methyl-D-erythritol kinase
MIQVRSFAKLNVGLCIGAARADGFHELRTVYQSIAAHDVVGVEVLRGSGIEIRCADSRVPKDDTNTCYRIGVQVVNALKAKGRVVISIDKRLPVQGGLGGASSNAVAVLLCLERIFKKALPAPERLRIAAEIGSDLPLFLVGGTVLGVGRGEEVYPLPDVPTTACVIVAPEVGVSTPQAFRDWDRLAANEAKLTGSSSSYRMNEFGRTVSSWLSGLCSKTRKPLSGVPAGGRGQGETPLLDLVHTGIENDFERVVFPKYPELCEIKQVLLKAGAFYASLSGSGSALYGLFRTGEQAARCATRMTKQGLSATATTTLMRPQYWRKFLVSGL